MTMRVYTKTGDKGTTGLIGGTRVSKDHIRLDAYGSVDELNSFTGTLYDHLNDTEPKEWLLKIQEQLFTIGSTLATDPHKEQKMKLPSATDEDIIALEKKIDYMEESLPPLKHFILPGGHIAASTAHVCRSVCRRAERKCIHLQNSGEPVSEIVLKYLNRLSDFFFVLSRYIIHQQNGQEIPWLPNK